MVERRKTRGPVDDTTFTRNLRFEMAGEEGRAMVGSTSVSVIIGVLWIVLVIFGPRTEASHLLSAEERPIEVQFEAPPPPPEPIKTEPTPAPAAKPTPAPAPAAKKPAGPTKAEKTSAQVASAFGGAAPPSGPVGDVSNVLRGVAVAQNQAPVGAATGGKSVLAYGQGGAGSRTPGRSDIGGGGSVGGIGGVNGGGGFGAQAVGVSAPRVIGAPSLGGPGRDAGELGTQVRDHQSQLRFCYDEYGLKVNPGLAGSVTISIGLAGSGSVTSASITNRTWSGAGVDGTENCILQRVRGWHFPSSPSGNGTYEFSFNFTK
jgi:hypothetical protein